MDCKLNGVYMGFLQKILCILAALAIYPATIVIPKQDNFDRQIFFPREGRVFEIRQYESVAERRKQISCLQKNVYFEAAVESTAGKLAVAHVTYNRVKNKYFPNNFCEVVYQGRHYASGHPKKNQCQFSWYCDGKHDVPYPGPTWKKTKELATWFYDNKDNIKDITDGALYYHADYIPDPRWAVSKKTQKTVQIDTHIFYARKDFMF
tara:strand:- start:88 stop:708 length:621 start_codon:yes stop_codon:yes gene_type:complete